MEYPHNLEPMVESSALLCDVDSLRRRMDSDGYLYFKNVLDARVLSTLRIKLVTILAAHGWIHTDNLEGANAKGIPFREGEEGFFDVIDKVLRLEQLYGLAQDPYLIRIMKAVLGPSAFPHPLSIVRLVFPNNPEITTPPHQDFRNNQGTPNLTAAWIPLSDCPIELGPIAILKGSHKFGSLPLEFHLGAGNRRAKLTGDVKFLPWVSTNFKLGDVLLFPALTVHSALENRDLNRMRLSVDFRYQLEGEALTEQSLNPHFGRLSWEEIYSDWSNSDYQYYWHNKNYRVVEWDNNLQALPDDHLKEAVRQTREYNKQRELRNKPR